MPNTKQTTPATPAKAATPKAALAIAYNVPEGVSHVQVIRDLIQAGHTKSDIIGAYVAARLPEFVTRTAYKGTEPKKLASIVRKHANTHFKLAVADLNPAMVAERAEQARVSLEKSRERTRRAEAKALALGVAI